MIYTKIINLLVEKPFYFLRPLQIVSEFIDTFMKFSNFIPGTLCPKGGAFDSLFCLEGGVFVHNDCPGGGFLLPSSRVLGVCPRGGWFWMKLIPA